MTGSPEGCAALLHFLCTNIIAKKYTHKVHDDTNINIIAFFDI